MPVENTTYEDVIIGRQAIFDRQLDVYGYELLHRDSSINPETEGDIATSRIILNTFIELGIESVVGNKVAFINLTDTFFQEHMEIPFNSEKVVLEVLENIIINDDVINAVKSMKQNGLSIALDDFAFEPHWQPLIPFTSIIKVELPAVDIHTLPEKIKSLKDQGIKLLAEKIETHEEFKICHAMGFDYFQGFYFAKPNIVKGKRLSENQLMIIRLLSTLNKPTVNIDEVEQTIASDPSLSLKILRYINSAAMGVPRKIDSIKQAIVLMGLKRIRAWASLIALSQVTNKPSELFQLAMIRANMCAELSLIHSPEQEDAAYTIGLLSILDALMDQPLDAIIQQTELSEDISIALLEHKGHLGKILKIVLAHEKQDWEQTKTDQYSEEMLKKAWLSSVEKATRVEQDTDS